MDIFIKTPEKKLVKLRKNSVNNFIHLLRFLYKGVLFIMVMDSLWIYEFLSNISLIRTTLKSSGILRIRSRLKSRPSETLSLSAKILLSVNMNHENQSLSLSCLPPKVVWFSWFTERDIFADKEWYRGRTFIRKNIPLVKSWESYQTRESEIRIP